MELDQPAITGHERPAVRTRPLLFTPLTLRGVTVRNRVVVSPMCQYLSQHGGPTDWHLVHLGRFAIGGAGIVFFEDSVVEARGRTTHQCAGLYDDGLIPRYRRITDFIKLMGSTPAIQLGHTGRDACTKGPLESFQPIDADDLRNGLAQWRPVAPSECETTPSGIDPLVLDRDEIGKVIEAFRNAAVRAIDAGFEICEIHGAHGYLIHQFLSPGANRRTDGYGGDLMGRMRFALEVVEAVRGVWPAHLPLFFRVSSVEGRGGSWGMNDTLVLCPELVARGIDVIDCSSGGIGGSSALPHVPRVPGFQAGYAERVRREVACRTMAVGGITTGRQAERILADGVADLVAVASQMMLDPNWAVTSARELELDDWYDLLPEQHAFRLRRRDAHLSAHKYGSPVRIPMEVGQSVPYDWEKQW